MQPDGNIVTLDRRPIGDSLPEIRSTTRQPIVTQRLTGGPAQSLSDARAAGVYQALEDAVSHRSQVQVLAEVEASGERGRGGAGYPTGAKWKVCAKTPSDVRYVIANGDEGDPGSYVDRVLMEHDPHAILEGMALCGYAVGAEQGVVFVRWEYPRAYEVMCEAVEEARRARLLGRGILGHDLEFNVTVMRGQGGYVCGEETALINAIEGERGEVRLRPPYPAESGLWGRPTIVNNVETLVNIPWIIQHGAEAYRALGTQESSGNKVICLNSGFSRPGMVEVEFGTPLAQVIEEAGSGAGAKQVLAVLLGGPMGTLLTPDRWDVPICYDEMRRRSISLGHGGVVAILEDTDCRALFENLIQFMADESCGKCVPCRAGSKRLMEMVQAGAYRRDEIEATLGVVAAASLCPFGHETPGPLRDLLELFGDQILCEQK
ncbi:NADH-quinone oxidoreductase subunit L [Phycisphaeraceae bacterium D3-23]